MGDYLCAYNNVDEVIRECNIRDPIIRKYVDVIDDDTKKLLKKSGWNECPT